MKNTTLKEKSFHRLLILWICLFFSTGCNGDDPENIEYEYFPSGDEMLAEQPISCQEVIPSQHALWSEFLDLDTVAEQVPDLIKHEIALYQNIRSEHIGDSQLSEFLDYATCMGMEVRAWLTLPEEDGYWPNEKNVDLFADKAVQLADWILEKKWPIEWIIVDMEPDFEMLHTLSDMLKKGQLLKAVSLLWENLDTNAYQEAVKKYTAMVEMLHEKGFKVMVVTFPMVLDDLWDKDSTIQDLINIPVHEVPWDEVSFMVYTTTFRNYLNSDVSAFLIYTYGIDAVRYYGEKAALDIGVIAHGGMMEAQGITDIQEIKAQVGAAKDAGVSNIHMYSLDGILHTENPTEWYEAFQTPAAGVKEQTSITLFRGLLKFLDIFIADVK